MPGYSLKDKKSFKEEVITIVIKIFELSCNEFRGGYTIKKDHGNWVEDVYVPDSRKIYCQAVECLNFILLPHFDLDEDEIKKLQKDRYEKIEKVKKVYDEVEKDLESNLKEYEDDKIKYELFIINKLRLMKQLFGQLMRLLKVLKINVVTYETRVG